MRLSVSVLVFEIGRMLYRSGIKMHLSLTKQISWEKSMSSSRTYLLKLFFISVSMHTFPQFYLLYLFAFSNSTECELCRCLVRNCCLSYEGGCCRKRLNNADFCKHFQPDCVIRVPENDMESVHGCRLIRVLLMLQKRQKSDSFKAASHNAVTDRRLVLPLLVRYLIPG